MSARRRRPPDVVAPLPGDQAANADEGHRAPEEKSEEGLDLAHSATPSSARPPAASRSGPPPKVNGAAFRRSSSPPGTRRGDHDFLGKPPCDGRGWAGEREDPAAGRLARHHGARLGAGPWRPADRGRPDRGGGTARRRLRRRGGRRPRPDRASRPHRHPSAHVAVVAADHRLRLDPRPVLRPDAGPARRRLPSGGHVRGHPARHGRGARLRHHHGRRLVAQPQRPRPRRRGMGRTAAGWRSGALLLRRHQRPGAAQGRLAPDPGRGPAPPRRRLRRPGPRHPGDGRAGAGVLHDRELRRRLGAGPRARAARHRPCGRWAPRDPGRGGGARWREDCSGPTRPTCTATCSATPSWT